MAEDEYPLVGVHIKKDDTKTPQSKPKEIVGIGNSYPLTVGATPVPILNHSPNRCRAQVIVNGTTGSIVALGRSASDCEQAQAVGAGEFIGAVVYVIGNYPAPIPLENTSEWYAALVVAGAGPTVVSVFKEVYTTK